MTCPGHVPVTSQSRPGHVPVTSRSRPGHVPSQVGGNFHFRADPSCKFELRLAAKVTFVGISIEGDIELSTRGGVEYALLRGSGETPTLCGACPKLKGLLEVEKTHDGVFSAQAISGN